MWAVIRGGAFFLVTPQWRRAARAGGPWAGSHQDTRRPGRLPSGAEDRAGGGAAWASALARAGGALRLREQQPGEHDPEEDQEGHDHAFDLEQLELEVLRMDSGRNAT